MATRPFPIREINVRHPTVKAAQAAPAPAPTPVQKSVAPQPAALPQPPKPAGPNKALILVEMAVLFGGTIAVHRNRGESWVDIWTKTALRSAMGTIIILAVLLTLDDLGAGSLASLFGGLIVLGYLLSAFGYLGPALLQLEQNALGVPPSTPTSLEGPSTQKAKGP